MNVQGKPYQSIWPDQDNPGRVHIINQNYLPFEFRIEAMDTSEQALEAIRTMKIRGAPLIGVMGAFGMYMACMEAEKKNNGEAYLSERSGLLRSARPTAVNLTWAVDRMNRIISGNRAAKDRIKKVGDEAQKIMEEEKTACLNIGKNGLDLLEEMARGKKGKTLNILTHCNAGWLACVDYGTATAPIYLAHDKGIPVHVWVDETRPRNQGARLTAWELGQHGIPHTVVVDNAGGHLMQKGLVDVVIVGSDRTTRNGDVANKIGTYLKALAAFDNRIPFYAALPSSSIDFSLYSGLEEIIIEERDPSEVRNMDAWANGKISSVNIIPTEYRVSNFGFDVTPARLVTALITEKGICKASEQEIMKLFPEK